MLKNIAVSLILLALEDEDVRKKCTESSKTWRGATADIDMLRRAPRICTCGRKVPAGITCQCQQDRAREREARRPSAAARGYDSKWRRESRAWLASLGKPRCFCGCGRDANTVEHKQAHKGDHRLFWDRANWQPAYGPCNNRKAARREGGFGNPVRPQ